MQSNISGGTVYDGLLITNNVIRVLNAQSADPERIIGIWENGHAHLSDIAVSGNQFVNQAAGNDPDANLQRAFRVTSHSSSTTTVTYRDNEVSGANIGFEWLAGQNFAGNQPVVLRGQHHHGQRDGRAGAEQRRGEPPLQPHRRKQRRRSEHCRRHGDRGKELVGLQRWTISIAM